MPTDVVSRQLAPITLTGNIEQYMYRYQISVCNLLGVPPDMVMSTPLLGGGDKPNGSYTMSSRVFSNNMRNLCNVLQTLAEQVYETIYDTDNVKMLLSTVPKLEIQNFDDLEKTVRSGAMSTEILELIARSLALDFGCVLPYITIAMFVSVLHIFVMLPVIFTTELSDVSKLNLFSFDDTAVTVAKESIHRYNQGQQHNNNNNSQGQKHNNNIKGNHLISENSNTVKKNYY